MRRALLKSLAFGLDGFYHDLGRYPPEYRLLQRPDCCDTAASRNSLMPFYRSGQNATRFLAV